VTESKNITERREGGAMKEDGTNSDTTKKGGSASPSDKLVGKRIRGGGYGNNPLD